MIGIFIIILCLILLNSIFVMSEIAIVSSRKSRLEELARKGSKAAVSVINTLDSPNKFLSTIQVGITLVGILIGVFSGTSISGKLESLLNNAGINSPFNHEFALSFTIIIITYFSIVIGELVPKRIGLQNPESLSLFLIGPLLMLSKIVYPFVRLLSLSTDLIIGILKIKKHEDSQVTEEEIKAMIEEGISAGEIQEIEQDIVERVFHLGDQQIIAIMTGRSDIVWIDENEDIEAVISKISSYSHSIYPVCNKNLDDVSGIIYVKDLFNASVNNKLTDVRQLIKPLNILPDTQKAYKTLEKFKETKIHFGLVVDEFGITQGIVTINDIMDALVGDITDTDEPEIIKRNDNSWYIDGKLAFFEFLHEFDIESFDYSKDNFHSVGGFIIYKLNKIPKSGDKFEWNGFLFEIVDMDGNRVDKILLTKSQ